MGPARGRAPLLWSLLVLLLLVAANYWPLILGKVPFPSYVVTQFPPWETVRGPNFSVPRRAELGALAQDYPLKSSLRESMSAGSLPLWNPRVLLGTPFQAEPLNALFYPLNLYYVLPTPVAWSLGFVFRTFLAGFLMTTLLRSLGAADAGALLGGIVFAFCGVLVSFQGFALADTSLWLPLIFLSVARLQQKPGSGSLALLAVAFALPVLAGHVENAFHAAIAGAAFALYRWVWPKGSSVPAGRRRFLAGFVAAALLAVALAAVQILPTLEWVSQLNRTLNKKWTARPSAQIVTFVSRDLDANPSAAGVPVPEGAAYAGMLTLLLAPLALLHRNRRDAIFFSVLAAVSLQVIYGWGPLYWLSREIPVIRGMPNGRLLAVVDFSLAVLAGLGISALLERERRATRGWWLLAGAAAIVAAIGIVVVNARSSPAGPAGSGPTGIRGPVASAFFLFVAGLLVALALRGRLKGRRLAVSAIALIGFDLVTVSYAHVPFVRTREIFPPAPVFDFLRQHAGTANRVVSVDATYAANLDIPYGLFSAGGVDSLLRRTARTLWLLAPPSDSVNFESQKIVTTPGRILDLMNVKYLVATTWNRSSEALASHPERFAPVFSEGSVRVFENRNVLPRAFLVPASGIEYRAGEDAEFARLRSPEFDPGKAVILAGTPVSMPISGESPPGAVAPQSTVSISGQGFNHLRLKVEAPASSVLVVSQTFYPGWRALVDGRDTEVLRADYTFTGVRLPPGRHDVSLVFRPPLFRLGAWLSSVGVVILLGLFALSRRRAGPSPREA